MAYSFEWSLKKELENLKKHGYSFKEALEVFADPLVIHLEDPKHSSEEDRFYAVGEIASGKILTVRYTVRKTCIRIFGAASWRKWKKYYEENTKPKKNEKNKGPQNFKV